SRLGFGFRLQPFRFRFGPFGLSFHTLGLGLSYALGLGRLALGLLRRLAQRGLLGFGLGARLLLGPLPLRFDLGQSLVRLPLGLGLGFRLLLRFLLSLSKSRSIRLSLSLRRFLSFALSRYRRLIALTLIG